MSLVHFGGNRVRLNFCQIYPPSLLYWDILELKFELHVVFETCFSQKDLPLFERLLSNILFFNVL